ncbi:Deoxycytidine kinase 1 [Hypoxylon texense]
MSQTTTKSAQVSGDRSQPGEMSEMMRSYLDSDPNTTTERLAQGDVNSDEEIMRSLREKELELDALMRQAKGDGSESA